MESSPDFENFDYPIQSCLDEIGQWRIEEVFDPSNTYAKPYEIPSLTELLNYDLFDKIIFAQEGENGGDSWIIVALHQNGYYILFDASCSSDGFDVQGGGLLLYTKSPTEMFEYGFDTWMRDLIPEFLEHTDLD